MSWPVWPKGNEKALAGYASVTTAHVVRLASPTADVVAKGSYRDVVRELYEAFLKLDIRWSREMYHPDEAVQEIRPPHAIMRGAGDGTCLDLAVLMAGAALGKELLPVVVVLNGHALLAVSNRTGRRDAGSSKRRMREGDVFVDGVAKGEAAAAALRKLVEAGEYTLVECTGFARAAEALDSRTPEGRGRDAGIMPFARAAEAGREQLDVKGRDVAFAIDVAYLQDITKIEQYTAVDDGMGRINADLRLRHRRLMEDYSVVGGREPELDQLGAFLDGQTSGYCIVTGPPGSGKTALLAEWIRRLALVTPRRTVYHFLSRQYGTADRQFDFLQSLLQQAVWAWSGPSPPQGSIGGMEASWLELLDAERPPPQPVVIVIDGADETDGWTLNRSMFPRRLPEGVHIVISARAIANTDWREELGIPDAETITLKGLDEDAVRAILELIGAPGWLKEPAAFALVSKSADGDPFYLRLICDQAASAEITTVGDLARAPRGLESFIKTWWEDVQGSAQEPAVQCLLSYLTVALAPMTREELVDIDQNDALTGFSFGSALKKVERYIAGDPSEVGISFAHWRLKDFISRRVLSPVEVGKATDTVAAWCDRWAEHQSRYALAKGFAHRLSLADATKGAARSAHYRALVDLVRDEAYQTLRAEKIGDASGLVADMSRLCEWLSAGGVDDVGALVAMALIYVDARTRLLQPAIVFSLGRGGDWENAIARLDLLPASEFWRAAARLCLAWQAATIAERSAARRLLDDETPSSESLVRLDARVRATVAGPEPVPIAPPSDRMVLVMAEGVLARLASRDDPEAVEYPPVTPFYGDTYDALDPDPDTPLMIEAARQFPMEGGNLLGEYIDQLGANPYSDYRNRALAYLLDQVSTLPDPILAREMAIKVVGAALQPSPVRFSEYLQLSHRQRQLQSIGDLPSRPVESELVDRARQLAQQAEIAINVDQANRRDRSTDRWSFLRREMGAVAETLHAVEPGHVETRRLLDLAARFESGFAGFRVPAFLALVDANSVVRPDDWASQRACLDRARRAAHNIQDPSFCARSTAMVNRAERWVDQQRSADELAADVEAFIVSPRRAVEFGALHAVGESFAERNRRDHLSIDAVTHARTLEQLAHVFELPIALMERANPGVGRANYLGAGQEVVVPDTAFVPLVATWFSAQVAAAGLDAAEKTRLLCHLVPITLSNPSALDAVLGRLVSVAPDVDLEAVGDVLGLARTFEPEVSWVEYPGAYS